MQIKTHTSIDQGLVGVPRELSPGEASVELRTTGTMAVDVHGLVHGGFVFGLADHAAMLAINHPNVVLGGAEVRFHAPVEVGDLLLAKASARAPEDKKQPVDVSVSCDGKQVFSGVFVSFIAAEHVLEGVTK